MHRHAKDIGLLWRMHLPLCTRRSPSRRRRLFRHPWCLWRRMSCRALPRSSLQARLVNQLQLHRVPPRPSLLPLTGQCWHTIHTTYVLSSAFWQLRDPPSFPPFPLFFLGYVSLVEMLYFVAHIVRPSLDGHRLIPRFVFAHCPCSHFVLFSLLSRATHRPRDYLISPFSTFSLVSLFLWSGLVLYSRLL